MTPPPDKTPPVRVVRIEPKCPICAKTGDAKYRPFCSKRCADIDLGRWLKEGYRVPTDEGPDGGETPPDGLSGQGG
ncbi:MAG: DNA gyrase inhibitor YacG [Proteobacteria bacterium]|nr:DNA gyrase inhibitor YacG [Pseudomonadota bacterium]